MPQRLAAILALLAFAVCLYVGEFQAGNSFTTTVGRALAAMAGTYIVGLVIGAMAKRAIEESLTPATGGGTGPADAAKPPAPTEAVKPAGAKGR